MDIAEWLKSSGLEEYALTFAENRIGPDVLPELTDQDLRDLGITALGDRKRLLAAIAGLNKATEVSSPPTSEPFAVPEGERRQVTVLFADIAGFTALSERIGAEATHEVLNHFFETADRVIEDFGGSVDKHIGDNVMAVFGAPVAHDNDPERAVRAALAIHEASRAIELPDGRPLTLHIGIAAGQVVASGTGSASHRQYTVTGDSVNLAARLQGLAGPEQTLVSETVQRQTSGRFAFTGLGPQRLKGIGRPVEVWRVDASAEAEDDRDTLFVGRRAELKQCRAILDEVVATRHGQVILLRGAAGIGKSRMAGEVLAVGRETGFAIHRSRILDFGSFSGRHAVSALLLSLLGLGPSSDESEQANAAEKAVEAGALISAQRVFLNDLLDLPQPVELRRIYDAMDDFARREGRRALVAGLVAWASRTSPQLIMVEDLHWADTQTLDILASLTAVASEHQVVFLATTRSEGDPLEGPWRALDVSLPISIINLGPLRAEEARALATGFAVANEDRLADCLERAGGNPLFLEQLLQNVAESAAAAMVPGSIQSLVLARIDRLDGRDKRAVQAASILGQHFTLAALRHLIDDPSYACSGLLRNQLLRPEGEDFLFTHALVREGVYGSILNVARKRLHLKAADWFAPRDPVLRAEHLGMAEDPGAAAAFLDAARSQLENYRYEQAAALLKKGKALASEPACRVELALTLGGAQHDLGRMVEARAAFDEALEAAQDDTARCRAWLGLAAVKRITEDLDGALADIDAAEAAAHRLGLEVEQARAHYLRGNVLFPRGDIAGCMREHEAALALAERAGSAELQATALGGLGDAEYMVGRMKSAHQRFQACVEVSRAHGLGRIEVANLPMAAITATWCGEIERARATASEAIEAARQVGHRRAEMIAHHAAFFCKRSSLEQSAARRHAEAATELARRLGAGRFEAEGMLLQAELDFFAGDRARALETVRGAVAISREVGMAYMGPALLGGLTLFTDDEAERRRVSAEAEALLKIGSISHNHILFRMYAIEAYLRAGEYDEARRHADALADFCPESGLTLVMFYADRGRVLARAARGERTEELSAEVDRLITVGDQMQELVAVGELRRAGAMLDEKAGTAADAQ